MANCCSCSPASSYGIRYISISRRARAIRGRSIMYSYFYSRSLSRRELDWSATTFRRKASRSRAAAALADTSYSTSNGAIAVSMRLRQLSIRPPQHLKLRPSCAVAVTCKPSRLSKFRSKSSTMSGHIWVSGVCFFAGVLASGVCNICISDVVCDLVTDSN